MIIECIKNSTCETCKGRAFNQVELKSVVKGTKLMKGLGRAKLLRKQKG